MAKSKERLLARQLRSQGRSIKEIAGFLHVSPGSVSVWCNDILLSKEQVAILQQRISDPYYGKKMDYLNRIKEKTRNKIILFKNEGINEVGKLSQRDIFMIGVALYWGEGFKKDHQLGFATSDVDMANFYIYWLKKHWHIKSTDLIIRLTANISYEDKIVQLEQYWSKELHVPLKQFSKPFYQKTKWKKEYDNPENYHGIIRIKVKKSVNLLRKMFGYIEALKNIY